MGKKSKDLAKVELCKWDKGSYEKNLETVMDIVNNPRYICKTCGRAARLKKNLQGREPARPARFPEIAERGRAGPAPVVPALS